MLRRLLITSASLIATLALPAMPAAHALSPPTPWDGANPFNCTIQNAGQGTAVPDPGADPYCVEFDKTNQNLTQLGIVSFLSKEPARVAAAVPKCFYFQEDHWRGTVNQTDPTALYEFVGHYFFNKATGDGGAWVTDFTLAGQTFDPTELPGFPPSWGRYFGPGTGGVITHNDIPADPRCAALAAKDPAAIYARAAATPRCTPGTGHIDSRGVGPIVLGIAEDALRASIGPPHQVRRGFLSYCVEGGGRLLAGEPGDRSGTLGSGGSSHVAMALTSSRGFVTSSPLHRNLRVGFPASALPATTRVGTVRGVTVMRWGNLLAGLAGHRIKYLGDYSRSAIRSRPALLRWLGRAW